MDAKLATKGGSPVRDKPFTKWPVFADRERELVMGVLDSGVWSFYGPREREFEGKWAAFCGATHAICVANGTVSLEIALRALGVGPGDEVIVPALTWMATAGAVLQVGAVPVFADIRDDDWCIDPVSIRQKLTPRTRVIMPVHLYSQVAQMDDILTIALEKSLHVVEDCAHAHGSRWKDRGVGALGKVGSFSFQQSKGMTSGEGGALVTNDHELAEVMYGMKNCGRTRVEGGQAGFGGNYRITEFQAAILLAQLDRIEQQLAIKNENIRLLRDKISSVPGVHITPPKPQVTRQGVYALSVRLDIASFANIPRDILIKALRAEGIPVTPPYEVVYASSLWTRGPEFLRFADNVSPQVRFGFTSECPVAERIADEEGIVIPHEVFLGDEKDMDDIAAAFDKVQKHASDLRFDTLERKARAGARAILKRLGLR